MPFKIKNLYIWTASEADLKYMDSYRFEAKNVYARLLNENHFNLWATQYSKKFPLMVEKLPLDL